MSKNTRRNKKLEKEDRPLTSDEKMKYEIAAELGLLDKVKDNGWKSLTAKETGRIGGLMTKKKRELLKAQVQD